MPRRFGVGVLLVIATMYAVLFALLRAIGAAAIGFALIGGFFTLVGLAQMLLFRGRKPRLASFLAGGVAHVVLVLPIVWGDPWLWPPDPLIPIVLIAAFLAGGLYGYVAGCLIAGVFLMLRGLERQDGGS